MRISDWSSDVCSSDLIAERDGVSIALSQVADVAFEPRVKRGDAGYMAEPAVIVSVMKQPGADSTSLVAEVKEALSALVHNFPAAAKLRDIVCHQDDVLPTSTHHVARVLLEPTPAQGRQGQRSSTQC